MKRDISAKHNFRRKSNDQQSGTFRKMGYELIDRIADLIEEVGDGPVTRGEAADVVQDALDSKRSLPAKGTDPENLLRRAADLLFEHSLYNGHPKFWGYITSSPLPMGMLGDLLASAVNANVGAWALSPMASEMERQAVRWIGEFMGYPSGGGLMVSGGNMANYIGFLAGMRSIAGEKIRTRGINPQDEKLICYCSEQTHTWVYKAADLFGIGTDNIRWIATDDSHAMDLRVLTETITADIEKGYRPFIVIGTAGSVSIGVVDPLAGIRRICDQYGLWFHIDGAYGGFAAALPEFEPEITGLAEADSVAVDPHKWLYAPLEAGCVLVKDPKCLTDAFSYHPPYYNFEDSVVNFVDYGMQNSRGFRALKVWLSLQQLGLDGYKKLIREDIMLAEKAYELFDQQQDFDAVTWHLSIATFRYIPADLRQRISSDSVAEYLNVLNKEILNRIQAGGKYFISNAVINEAYVLRLCIVNFRTTIDDIEDFPAFVKGVGVEADNLLRKQHIG